MLTILPTDKEVIAPLLAAGVDKVIFTGSSEHGRDLLHMLSETTTPAIMELSGHDPVILFADADLDLVIKALRFGRRWNNGNTCIAPRQILAHTDAAKRLRVRLESEDLDPLPVIEFTDESTALQLVARMPFGLGATIFSRNTAAARRFARHLRTGFVLINDMIVPTADPRFPFGGQRASGFGVTRGEEGLLEMTRPHVVAVRRGRKRRHFDELTAEDGTIFSSYITAAHGAGWGQRGAAVAQLGRALFGRGRKRS